MNKSTMKIIAVLIVLILAISAIGAFLVLYEPIDEEDERIDIPEGVKVIEKEYSFSYPEIKEGKDDLNIYVAESDFNSIHDQWPVLPVNVTTFELPFGSEIVDFETHISKPENISLPKRIAYGSCSTLTEESEEIYNSNKMYPSDYVSYHLGGGLSDGEHKTFITVRVNPITYFPVDGRVDFVEKVNFKIYYEEPNTPILDDVNKYDLLVISPDSFVKNLQKLVDHKNNQGVNTEITTVQEINQNADGRDLQEKIKYYIKQEIENSGIKYVLLVGGRDGQSANWHIPVRYSHVLIRDGTQEIIEPEFISDVYYSDIYDSTGNFSSWDTNNNDVFAEFDGEIIDDMDLYPDVILGRLPCRDKREVKTIVDKIISYETQTKGSEWFKNMILVSGDHWADEGQISEGVLIMEKAQEIMDDFNPVELYAKEDSVLLTRQIRKAMNQGAGFAYFCGHGGINAWGIHYPPDATGWAPSMGKLGLTLFSFYKNYHMNFLRNKNKLPVTLVGGCNNGQFDVAKRQLLMDTHCWAWHLTVQKRGGSIATIANTGLGTHAMDDNDNNGVNDYLEIYDGWLELNFLKLYQNENIDILGEIQQEDFKEYLHSFLGAGDEMDIKMVQQWQLFGDPTLKIGGY